MNHNDPEVGNELHRLAHAEPLTDFDTNAVLARGRGGLRRRRLLGVGGGIAGVAAIAVAAAFLPGNTQAGPPVAAEQSQFDPVPGLPRGEEALFKDLPKQQVTELCALRNPGAKLKLKGDSYRVGNRLSFDFKPGTRGDNLCQIPGGDRPTAKMIAESKADPLPKTEAGLLRNCSIQTWVDVTGWRIVASDRNEAVRTAEVVALSPSGRSAMACAIYAAPTWYPFGSRSDNTLFMRMQQLGSSDPILVPGKGEKWAELIAGGSGTAASCDDKLRKCYNDGYAQWGRAPANAVSVKVSLDGKSHTQPVNDGWWAVVWQTPTRQPQEYPKLFAYDKNGKIVKDYSH
ncbi:hypothetical protein ACIA49_08700 [Kribbella sp. NPDC051587]|uniref:hypothetical protein n=1 Tax=Kribbella sp. NPDC051587 TaxID=3364119 RepID=UPI0037A48413